MSLSTVFDLTFKNVQLNGGSSGAVGDEHIAIGAGSGKVAQGDSTVAIGNSAGNASQGLQAVAIGAQAGNASQGAYAIAIGSSAGEVSQGAQSIALGYYAGYSGQDERSIVIDASGSASSFIDASAGRCYIRPIGSQAASSALNWNATTNEIHLVTSMRETKKDIEDLAADTSKVFELQARQFRYKDAHDQALQYGYIADEAQAVADHFATYDTREHDKAVNINWNVLTCFLLEEVKKLRQEVDELKSK
jgi:hypothetical protein